MSGMAKPAAGQKAITTRTPASSPTLDRLCRNYGCSRLPSSIRSDGFCEKCGRIKDVGGEDSRLADLLPCTDEAMGLKCGPMNHYAACPRYKKPVEKPAKVNPYEEFIKGG